MLLRLTCATCERGRIYSDSKKTASDEDFISQRTTHSPARAVTRCCDNSEIAAELLHCSTHVHKQRGRFDRHIYPMHHFPYVAPLKASWKSGVSRESGIDNTSINLKRSLYLEEREGQINKMVIFRPRQLLDYIGRVGKLAAPLRWQYYNTIVRFLGCRQTLSHLATLDMRPK